MLLIYLLSYTLNPLLSLFFKHFLQFSSVLIIIDLVLALVLGLEGQVLVNITDRWVPYSLLAALFVKLKDRRHVLRCAEVRVHW